jgi:hypothetical protein
MIQRFAGIEHHPAAPFANQYFPGLSMALGEALSASARKGGLWEKLYL